MPEEDKNILNTTLVVLRSLKAPFIIYADLECILKKE